MTKYILTSREMAVLATLYTTGSLDLPLDYIAQREQAKLSIDLVRNHENLIELGLVELETIELENEEGEIEVVDRQVLSSLGELVFLQAEPRWKIPYDVEVEI